MDEIKKIILVRIPMSICNFRCHYCYLAQRDECYQGIQPQMKYTPEEVARAFTKERIGGIAYFNFCADGETLLTKDIDKYVKAILEEGHYVEFVTNLTITPMLNKFLEFPVDLLKRLEFKCSFHYLELKRRNLLNVFAANVNKIWAAGASANIEITPSDELIPYLDEVKEFSMKEFGALPHLTIARNDRTREIAYLTELDMSEYDKVWSQFDSSFWKFKKEIFGIKQKDFCYAGKWSIYVDLTTGNATPCYCGNPLGDIMAHPELPIPESPVGKCPIAHCYNGHALLTLGLIPTLTTPGYGDVRDRVKRDGTHWLQPELLSFFNTKLVSSNSLISETDQKAIVFNIYLRKILRAPFSLTKRLYHKCIKH